MPQSRIGEQLRHNKRWQFIPGRNRILPVIESVLKSDEQLVDIIDGFFPESAGKNGSINDSGLILVTDRSVMLIRSDSPGAYELLKREKISGITFDKNFSSLTLKIDSGKRVINFVTHLSENAVKNMLILAEKPAGSDNTEITGSEGKTGTGTIVITDAQKVMSGLMIAETKKIRDKISELSAVVSADALSEKCRNDLMTLTALCGVHKRRLTDNELLFIHMSLSACGGADKGGVASLLDEVALHDSMPFYVREKLSSKMYQVIEQVKKIDESGVSKLSAIEYLTGHDREHDTGYADRVASLYYEYSQCLLKADGVTDGTEELKLKKISEAISSSRQAADVTPEGISADEETIEKVMEKINELVGMDNIKEEIKSFINYVSIRREREKRGLPVTPLSLHAVFYGPPGTGKTTIARLLGRVYKSLGLLKSGHVVETDRAGLVAGYVGQTAIKTDEMVSKAKDGVLFIDEAYTLIPENSSNDFGSESVDTVLKRMEDMREGFAVIAAGYTDEMERFINSNPGLKSRFSRYFYFSHYTPDELMQIFGIFAKNVEFRLSDRASAALKDLITHFYDLRGKSFGNARFVRNVFDRIVQNQADRLASVTPLTDELLCEVTEEDIPKREDFSSEQFA